MTPWWERRREEPVLDVHEPRVRRTAVAVWAAVMVGMLVAVRAVSREPGEALLPASVVIGAGVGLLVAVVGVAWYLRSLALLRTNGPSSPALPWRVRRALVRLDPAPEPYRQQVPDWLESRRRLVRTVFPQLMAMTGQGLAINSSVEAGWSGLALFVPAWAGVYLVLGTFTVVYRRRIDRALRHFRDLPAT